MAARFDVVGQRGRASVRRCDSMDAAAALAVRPVPVAR